MPKLLIYLPSYNEEENIMAVLESLPQRIDGFDQIESLVIDDGSSDNTAAIAKKTKAHVISHLENLGVGGAFHSAVKFALENQFDVLVGIDADRQFISNEISMMVEPLLNKQADMVIGNRFNHGKPQNMDSIKYHGNVVVSKIISRICDQKFADVSCGYRAYNREALLRFNLFGTFTYTHETILSLIFHGKRVIQKNVTIFYHTDRKSRVASSILKYALETSKIILQTILDYKPGMIFTPLGSFFFLLGGLLGFASLIYYLIFQSFTPYKFLGILGLGSLFFGLSMYLIALLTNIFRRLRISQEELLYQIKLIRYGK